jgi:hypothetical protein
MKQPFTNTDERLAQPDNSQGDPATITTASGGLGGWHKSKKVFQWPWFEKAIAEDPAWRNQADGYLE